VRDAWEVGGAVIAFEISVNGREVFVGERVTAITLVSELAGRRQTGRVSLHVGVGGPGERQSHFLSGDLRAGDEVSIRLLDEDIVAPSVETCSFCGRAPELVKSLVVKEGCGICDICIASLSAALAKDGVLPAGATLVGTPGVTCCFCSLGPPRVTGWWFRTAKRSVPSA